MESMRVLEGERWVDPYDYKRRSRSLENDPGKKVRLASLNAYEGEGLNRSNSRASNLVNRGLSLVGCALKSSDRTSDVAMLKAKNYSTGAIETSASSSVEFDPNNPPDDSYVDGSFDELLRDGKFFWGDARRNLQGISRRRKWALVCKFSNESLNGSTSVSDDSITIALQNNQFLQQLDQLLESPDMLSKTLHKLERCLRQVSFSESFLSQNHFQALSQCAPSIKPGDQFVYLRCFKTLMNYEQGRLEILNSSPLISFLCLLLSDEGTHLSIKLLSSEMLLLLTYVDEQFGYEKVLCHLRPCLSSWLKCVENVLLDDVSSNEDRKDKEKHSPFYVRLNAERLMTTFVTNSLFLINSITQALPSRDQKIILIKNLRENKIHHSFHLMKKLESDVIAEQVKIYTELENKLTEDSSYSLGLADSPYEPVLHQLVNQTKGTLIEHDLRHIFESLSEILTSRTTSESIKLFRSLGSILDYLIANFYTEVSSEPASLIQQSINKFLDNLESDEVARRAMNEMTELEETITALRKQLSEFKQFKDLSKEKLVNELENSKRLTKTKDTEIVELSKRLEQTNELRRKEKKKLDYALSRKDLDDSKINHASIFDNLKIRKNPPVKKLNRASSLLKSQRVHSLSSYVQTSDLATGMPANNTNQGSYSYSNASGQLLANSSDEKLRKIEQGAVPDSYDLHLTASSESRERQSTVPETLERLGGGQPTSNVPQLPPLPPLSSVLPPSSLEHQSTPPIETVSVPPPPPPPPLPNETGTNTKPPPPPPPLPETFSNSQVKDNSQQPSNRSSAPPPPPLPVSFLTSQTSSPKPRQVLKQIHWDKLNDIEETLWEDRTQKDETLKELKRDGIFSQVENIFKVKERVTKPVESCTSIEKKNAKTFLPRDLAQQFGINLHMFSNYSTEEFVLKVLQCDNEVVQNSTALEFFSREDLIKIPPSLKKVFDPYSTHYFSKESPSKDPSELDRPDRIFLELCYNLRFYWHERSLCLFILTTYERDYYDLVYRLQKIDDVIQRLKHASKLKNFLFIVMEIGNYMNKRHASGIRLSSLSKLAFVKSTSDSNMSFLHYVENLIRVKYPDIYGFTDDLKKVEDLGKMSLDHLELECEEFCSKINKVVEIMKTGKLSDPDKLHPDDLVVSKITYKIHRAKSKSDLLHDQCRLIKNDLRKLMKYFGEDFNDPDSRSEFFQNFTEFSFAFKKCAKENLERAENDRIYEQRKTMIELRQNPASGNESKSEEECDAVDVLLAKLRGVESTVEPLRRRRSTKIADTMTKDNTLKKSRPIPAGSNGILLERTQAMLDDIQKI